MNAKAHNKHWDNIRAILIGVLLLNWLVAAFKLVFGYAVHSQSMVADGYHSFADGASNIIGLVGIWYASFPRDADHPYGHKKYETFASIGIAILLFVVCFNILHEALARLLNPVIPQVTAVGFIIMFMTMCVNFVVMTFERRKGKMLNSDILVSDSMHTRADILTSLTVITSFVFIKMGYPIVDTIFAAVIALFIGYAGMEILRKSSRVLCDEAVVDPEVIRKIVNSNEGVVQCHRIRTRGRKDDVYIDLHVLLDDNMSLKQAHEISYLIERSIKKQIPGVSDVVVHLEPVGSQRHGDR
ncbi:MAG: cation diffusion facilitator family transporter [Candidatus Omnitrophica bacterium]|nr:cation diffusion facilitator family transporter [Candidatus Omnitrophota bacterium]